MSDIFVTATGNFQGDRHEHICSRPDRIRHVCNIGHFDTNRCAPR